jgi:hypothetical protein
MLASGVDLGPSQSLFLLLQSVIVFFLILFGLILSPQWITFI